MTEFGIAWASSKPLGISKYLNPHATWSKHRHVFNSVWKFAARFFLLPQVCFLFNISVMILLTEPWIISLSFPWKLRHVIKNQIRMAPETFFLDHERSRKKLNFFSLNFFRFHFHNKRRHVSIKWATNPFVMQFINYFNYVHSQLLEARNGLKCRFAHKIYFWIHKPVIGAELKWSPKINSVASTSLFPKDVSNFSRLRN